MGLMQVAEGIHKVEGVRVANVWLVEIEDGLLLVDAGTMLGTAGRVLSAIADIGRQPGDLRSIVLTHCDMDHVGGVAELKRRTGAQVAIHELDAPVLTGVVRPQKGGLVMAALYRLLVRPVAPDLFLHDGDTIGGLRVLHVPGHTQGSIALVREDGVVFSGDALLSDKHGAVLPPDPRLAHDRAQAAASAERIRVLHFRVLLTGHGAPAST
jgi:glyoxylase-like metal-dependent hydrolase (beta-lactamase superfamily II)